MLYLENIHTILQYTTVYFAVYEFTLHNFWFHSENQRGHLLLFLCTSLFVQYSIWLTVHVTVDASSTIHSVPSCHTRTLPMCVIFFRVEQFIQTGFCVFLQTIKLLPWHFLEIRHEDCEFCQYFERETG